MQWNQTYGGLVKKTETSGMSTPQETTINGELTRWQDVSSQGTPSTSKRPTTFTYLPPLQILELGIVLVFVLTLVVVIQRQQKR